MNVRVCFLMAARRYYKRFDVPELDVLGLPLEDSSLSWTHANNTLIITMTKPAEVLEAVCSLKLLRVR